MLCRNRTATFARLHTRLRAPCFPCIKSLSRHKNSTRLSYYYHPHLTDEDSDCQGHVAGKGGKGQRQSAVRAHARPLWEHCSAPTTDPQNRGGDCLEVAWEWCTLPSSQPEPCRKAPENNLPRGSATNPFFSPPRWSPGTPVGY